MNADVNSDVNDSRRFLELAELYLDDDLSAGETTELRALLEADATLVQRLHTLLRDQVICRTALRPSDPRAIGARTQRMLDSWRPQSGEIAAQAVFARVDHRQRPIACIATQDSRKQIERRSTALLFRSLLRFRPCLYCVPKLVRDDAQMRHVNDDNLVFVLVCPHARARLVCLVHVSPLDASDVQRPSKHCMHGARHPRTYAPFAGTWRRNSSFSERFAYFS